MHQRTSRFCHLPDAGRSRQTLALFTVPLFAKLIANDKPLLIRFEDRFHFPLFETYAETEFGGVFEVEADYKERVVRDLIFDAGGWMIWPPVRFSYDTVDYDLPGAAPYPPSGEHWLGTDMIGKDVLASLIYGVRPFLFGLALTFFVPGHRRVRRRPPEVLRRQDRSLWPTIFAPDAHRISPRCRPRDWC